MGSADLPHSMRVWQVLGYGRACRLGPDMRPVPLFADDEVVVSVTACGVCRTDLHLADGDLLAKAPGRVPGHEVIGRVVARGADAQRFALGERIGIAWLRRTCGSCRWCRAGRENLCLASQYTGWDADGGFAEYAAVPEAFAYRVPAGLSDTEAAPLLCSGIIGYRALVRAGLPRGGRLGLYGFGASAHLTAQSAIAMGAEVHVLTRETEARRLALELGAASVGGAYDPPPVPLDAAILFAPIGDLVPVALAALDQGGTLAVAGIHLTDIPALHYQQHLFRERTVTSVTANIVRTSEELLRLAVRLGVRASTQTYLFEQTLRALDDLAEGEVRGAAVVVRDA